MHYQIGVTSLLFFLKMFGYTHTQKPVFKLSANTSEPDFVKENYMTWGNSPCFTGLLY